MNYFSKIKTLAVVLTLTAAASAQFSLPTNARKAGMAGAPVSDISSVFNYPAMMMGYTDHVQATFNDGGIIGIKSVNDAFAIGILANQGLMTDHDFGFGTTFTSSAENTLNNSIGPPAPTFNNGYNVPHLLLGFDLAAFSFGADIFFEYARYSSSNEAGSSEVTAGGLILNPGARLSAAFDLGAVGVLAKFGMGLPSFSGEVDAPATAGDVNVSSKKGLYMEMGAEVAADISNVDWTLGGAYTVSEHQINVDNSNSFWNSSLTFYLDAEFNVLETAVAAAEYAFTRNAATTVVGDDPDVKDMTGRHVHSFAAGLENTWDKAWIFDSFSLRGGAHYDIAVDVTSSKATPNASSRSKQPGVHSAVSPVMGIGASKSFFTLDLCLDMGRWAGAFIGPPVALVSGTVKF
jgi:hypothetical protein